MPIFNQPASAGGVPSTGGTFTGPVEIDNSDDDAAVAFHVVAGSGATVGIDVQVDPSDSVVRIQGLDNNSSIVMTDDFSTDELELRNDHILLKSGTDLHLFAHASIFQLFQASAPSDGALVPASFALWLDATDGAAKLMVKAKSADGTVVTGSVSLAP